MHWLEDFNGKNNSFSLCLRAHGILKLEVVGNAGYNGNIYFINGNLYTGCSSALIIHIQEVRIVPSYMLYTEKVQLPSHLWGFICCGVYR